MVGLQIPRAHSQHHLWFVVNLDESTLFWLTTQNMPDSGFGPMNTSTWSPSLASVPKKYRVRWHGHGPRVAVFVGPSAPGGPSGFDGDALAVKIDLAFLKLPASFCAALGAGAVCASACFTALWISGRRRVGGFLRLFAASVQCRVVVRGLCQVQGSRNKVILVFVPASRHFFSCAVCSALLARLNCARVIGLILWNWSVSHVKIVCRVK